jgi:lipoprotein-anchoring transpeptidase ErfK/SrfK
VVVALAVVLIMVAAGGVLLATRGGDTASAKADAKAEGSTSTTGTDSKTAKLTSTVSATYATPPLRTATTKGGDIAVYTAPDDNAQPVATLSKVTEYNLPRSMLVFDQYKTWLHAYLPARPNSSTGWIKASDVVVSAPLTYEIKVSLADHKVTLLHDGAVVFEAPAAIGTPDDPTPTGVFFYTDPLDLASDPGTAYGVFAIGLSGHSNVLTEFAGSDGQIAIHGTNEPGAIGSNVSHGCVRVNNDIILKLSKLPLGTPVVIT